MARKTVTILGVQIDSTSKGEVLDLVSQKTAKKAKPNKLVILTPNPEILLASYKDPGLRQTLNDADVCIPDGVGLLWAERFNSLPKSNSTIIGSFVYILQAIKAVFLLNKSVLELIKGRSLVLDLLDLGNQKGLKVYFLGSTQNVILKTLSRVAIDYPGVRAKGFDGPVLNLEGEAVDSRNIKAESRAIFQIKKFTPDILFIAFGHPKQEKWISKNIESLNSKVIMAVGGSLDYYSGEAKLPPSVFEKLGAEWFWRLLTDPKRYRRILNAIVIFPYKVIKFSKDK